MKKQIDIREKIIPFSHEPGISCILPLSDLVVTAYPAMLSVGSLNIPIRITGPVEQFLVQMDLERDCVWVSATPKEGYFRLKLSASPTGLLLTVDRAPARGIGIGDCLAKAKDQIAIAVQGQFICRPDVERISLGNWKAQDWEMVSRRNDLNEILPALYLLGQKVPPATAHGGTASLLETPEGLQPFLLTAFSGILVPHLQDLRHQGIALATAGHGAPTALLSMAMRLIRSFLIVEENPLQILPHLPRTWIAGRATALRVANLGRIDLEWTKNTIRRMVVHADKACSLSFAFAKQIATFRCNGKRMHRGELVSLQAGKTFFDCFGG